MSRRTITWKALAVLCGLFFAIGGAMVACGGDDTAVPGDGGGGGDGTTLIDGSGGGDGSSSTCGAKGTTCAGSSDCCSALCDVSTHTCTGGLGSCTAANGTCSVATDCCSLSCVSGKCSGTECISDNKPCTANDQCCGGVCGANGTCTPLNNSCLTAGNTCTAGGEGCCSTLCSGGLCQLAASFCTQAGDVCAKSADCCTGICNIAAGASLGTCSVLPNLGRNNCSGGVDGTVCGGGTNDGGAGCLDCCSRLCAPFAPTGVFICQPANGCHVEGDLCQKDTDCCGGEANYPDGGEPLPGSTRVQCLIAAGDTIGYCASPGSGALPGQSSCNPEGNVCHFKDSSYICGNSSEENNCCDHLGVKTDCTLDSIGVPRCHVVGVDGGLACIPTDGECAFDGDCCGGKCLPDSTGKLVCNPVTCSPSTGTCTTTADCCDGLNCIIQPGSTDGTCGGSTTGGDGGLLADGGTGSCAAYGQSCMQASDCCNGVPCTNGSCQYPPR